MHLPKIRCYKKLIICIILLIITIIILQEVYLQKARLIITNTNLFIDENAENFKRFDKNTLFDSLDQTNINECHKQWFQLNNHVFFRPYFSLYFLDLNELRLYYSKHREYNYTFVLDIRLEFKDNSHVDHKITTYEILMHSGHDNFKIQSVRANLSLPKLIPNKYKNQIKDFKNDIQMLVSVSTLDGKHRIKTPLKISIKNFRENDSLKKKGIICSKQFYFNINYSKTFMWWIELNRMHGYDKLVFFNHSIPNEPELNEAFKKHSDFIEIKQLQCYPNFIDANNTNKLFINEYDFRNTYRINPLFHHLHMEFLCYNECFFENIDKYIHIAVFDQDESIIPRRIEKLTRLNVNTTVSKYDYNNAQCSNSTHITSYFNQLKTRLDATGNYKHLNFQNGTLSFHFLMTLFIKHETIKQLFTSLEAYYKSNTNFTEYYFQVSDPNDRNQQDKLGVNYNVMITNQNEYLYGKALYDLYKQEIESFMKRNEDALKILPEAFNRFYFVNGDSTSWMCGKTVHHTQMSHWVSNHYPEGNNFLNLVWTPHQYGHLSHFRTSLKDLNGRNISISNFNFDLNYFQCYFKPIVKKLNFNINF